MYSVAVPVLAVFAVVLVEQILPPTSGVDRLAPTDDSPVQLSILLRHSDETVCVEYSDTCTHLSWWKPKPVVLRQCKRSPLAKIWKRCWSVPSVTCIPRDHLSALCRSAWRKDSIPPDGGSNGCTNKDGSILAPSFCMFDRWHLSME